jgi:RNA polymerase sigma factor (sigma-70 family)
LSFLRECRERSHRAALLKISDRQLPCRLLPPYCKRTFRSHKPLSVAGRISIRDFFFFLKVFVSAPRRYYMMEALLQESNLISELSDIELVEICKAGDQPAYSALVQRHFRKVFAICISMLSHVQDAEDATQDTFTKGFTKLGSLQDSAKFSQWIIRVAKNNCYDLLRKRSRHKSEPILESHAAIKSDAERTDMLLALEKLPAKHREPLMLYYFNGKDSRAVGEALALTTKGAATRLARARRALRDLLEEEWRG